jgi:hypothetical protein
MSDYIDHSDRSVAGFCPMGCGATLFLASAGMVVCCAPECPRGTAVCEILAENEQGHIVEVDPFNFSMVHPLRERLDQELLDCELSQYLQGLAGPPVQTARYRVTGSGTDWVWEKLG